MDSACSKIHSAHVSSFRNILPARYDFHPLLNDFKYMAGCWPNTARKPRVMM